MTCWLGFRTTLSTGCAVSTVWCTTSRRSHQPPSSGNKNLNVMNVVLRCLLLTLFLATAESPATAQILKNLFGREQRKPVRRPPNNAATTSPRLLTPAASSPRRAASAPPKPKPFEYPDTKRKPRYRVDVLVQLY